MDESVLTNASEVWTSRWTLNAALKRRISPVEMDYGESARITRINRKSNEEVRKQKKQCWIH